MDGKSSLQTYIPTAVSRCEAQVLAGYSRDRTVLELGSLLGYSTICMAKGARHVITVDRHTGYDGLPNDSYKSFRSNLDIESVSGRVEAIIGDFHCGKNIVTDFAFVDLDGTYETTLQAIAVCCAPIVAVHDFDRTHCRGVSRAVRDSGLEVVERVDSLVVLRRR
jgi:predicted O-methyltransferase YrrM